MSVGNQFKPPKPPKEPRRMDPAPPLKPAAPPPDMGETEKIMDDSDEEKLSTRKKKALEIQKVKEGVKTFGAVDPSTMPQGPEGGIAPPV